MWCSAIGVIAALTLSLLVALLTAEAQQRDSVPRIGILTPAAEASTPLWEAFRQGLRALGYVEGRNIILEYRFAAGKSANGSNSSRKSCPTFLASPSSGVPAISPTRPSGANSRPRLISWGSSCIPWKSRIPPSWTASLRP
jgi:hypothetical protein